VNDLVTTETRQAATSQARTQPVGRGLAATEAKYLAPTRRIPWESRNTTELIRLTDSSSRPTPERGREALALGIDPVGVEAFITDLTEAVEGRPDANASRVFIGLMVVGYPSGRPADMDGYLETLLYYAGSQGFSPQVVAAACQKLSISAKFMPSCAEFVTAAIEAREGFDSTRRSALMIQRRLQWATDALTYQPKLVERA